MCRYATKTYKSHFACFKCQRAFKKTSLEDYVKHKGIDGEYRKITKVFGTSNRKKVEEELGVTYEQIEEQYLNDVSRCPKCGEKMAAMGLDFKAPKKNDNDAWKIIAQLYENGFAFEGCGCSVGYTPPSKLSELQNWIQQHSRKSEGEMLLNAINAK